MKRTIVAVGIIVALLTLAVVACAMPLNEDWGYAAYRKGPCDKCVAGVRPAMSTTYWLTTPTVRERYPQKPWLTIRVNGRDTDLGKSAVVLDRQLMLPVMTAEEFGLTPTRSGLNHQLLTISGGRYLVRLRIGSRQAEVGYALRRLPVCPKWYNGKVYMPAESIGKLLDWECSFNSLTGVLSVRTKGADVLAHKNAARWAFKRKLYDEAIDECTKAIALDPGDWLTYRRLGDALAAKAKFNEALNASHAAIGDALEGVREYTVLYEQQPTKNVEGYSRAVKLAVDRVRAYRTLGAKYVGLTDVREPDQALDIYEKALIIGPSAPQGVKSASPIQVRMSDLNQAIPEAEQSAAEAAARTKADYTEALTAYREAIERAPASHVEFKRLAETYHKANQLREAVDAYQKALVLDPEHVGARLELAQALIGQGKYTEAVDEATRAIDMAPGSAAAYNILGYALRKQGKDDDAVTAYRKAIELDPEFALAYNNLGVALLGMEQAEDAVKSLAKAVELVGTRADFFANYGLALLETNQVDEAGAAWSTALALCPCTAEYHAYLGMVMQRQGNVDGGIAESRAAIAGYEDSAKALRAIKSTAAQKKAKADLDHAAVMAHTTLAWGLLERGRPQEAIAEAREAVKLNAKDAAPQAALAAALAETLELSDASSAIAKALASDGDNELYIGIAAAAKALAGQNDDAVKLLAAMKLPVSDTCRWTWYFVGRANAALGRTTAAVKAFRQPQPSKYDAGRRAHIADYLARHGAKADAELAEEIIDDVAAPDATASVLGGRVEMTSAVSSRNRPVLKLANKSGKDLTVVLERNGDKSMWGLPAGDTTAAREIDAGVYQYTIRGGASPISGACDLEGRRSYTMTVALAAH